MQYMVKLLTPDEVAGGLRCSTKTVLKLLVLAHCHRLELGTCGVSIRMRYADGLRVHPLRQLERFTC